MPSAYIKALVAKTGKPKEELEAKWKKAKSLAAEQGHAEDYAYITGIMKKMVGEEEFLTPTFKEYLDQ